MNKTLKKIVALMLSLIMILSVSAVCFSVFAEDGAVVENTEDTAAPAESEHPAHTTFLQLFVDFFKEVFNFFKYIYYDVFLGKPVPEVPPMVQEGR